MLLTTISFYGGVKEIGGNKFLIEDKGIRVFLDFGMQFALENKYFAEYIKPRTFSISDLFKIGLLPDLPGIYRNDYLEHIGRTKEKEPSVHAIIISHAHLDHAAYLHFIRPDIDVYCTEATKLIMDCLQETSAGSFNDYLTVKENFKVRPDKKKSTELVRIKGDENSLDRNIIPIKSGTKFTVGNTIRITPWAIDHSIPGVCGFFIQTSDKTIAYTADIRYHGRRAKDTEIFVEKAAKADVLLCEGTRIENEPSHTENDVQNEIHKIVADVKGLAVANWPTRDLDRFLSFYYAAKTLNRYLAIDTKTAYLLELFSKSEECKDMYPKVDDPLIKICMMRKSWGLIGEDESKWSKKIIGQDYSHDAWEQKFLEYDNMVTHKDVKNNQSQYMLYCNDYHLSQLFDIKPVEGSTYIRSMTEPFDQEMILDWNRTKNWLELFGLPTDDAHHVHVSGHGSANQIKQIIEGIQPKTLIPIHTKREDIFQAWYPSVKLVELNTTVPLD